MPHYHSANNIVLQENQPAFFDQNSYQNVTHIIVISLEILYPSWFFKKNSDQKMQKSRFLEKL